MTTVICDDDAYHRKLASAFLPMLCYKVTGRLWLQKSTSFVATLLQPFGRLNDWTRWVRLLLNSDIANHVSAQTRKQRKIAMRIASMEFSLSSIKILPFGEIYDFTTGDTECEPPRTPIDGGMLAKISAEFESEANGKILVYQL